MDMTVLRCFITLGVGSAVLRSNSITLFAVVEMLTPFCGERSGAVWSLLRPAFILWFFWTPCFAIGYSAARVGVVK